MHSKGGTKSNIVSLASINGKPKRWHASYLRDSATLVPATQLSTLGCTLEQDTPFELRLLLSTLALSQRFHLPQPQDEAQKRVLL